MKYIYLSKARKALKQLNKYFDLSNFDIAQDCAVEIRDYLELARLEDVKEKTCNCDENTICSKCAEVPVI